MTSSSPTTADAPLCVVYYDGSCPLCRAEIDLYRRLGSRVRFHDLTGGDGLPPGVARAEALGRFHAIDAHGHVQSGARAFATLWKASPGAWRLLGPIIGVPPFVWIAEGLYRLFLCVRPRLQQAFHRRSEGDG